MSFTKVNPSGWSVGAKLTSVQIGNLDSDHAKALDKSVAGDTLSGAIAMANTASITASNAGNIVASSAAGIQTSAAGGIQLAGGGTDWVTFSAARSRSQLIWLSSVATAIQSGWANEGVGLTGPATSTAQSFYLMPPHNGAKLASVDVWFVVQTPHASIATGWNAPSIRVQSFLPLAGSVVSTRYNDLSTSTTQSPSPANNTAWYNGGGMQTMTYTANQNNSIATNNFMYLVTIVDETGTNSVAGNLYVALSLNFSNINNMQFP